MTLSAKVAYNTIIQIISKVISTILGLVAVALMTRYLGQKGFGQYTTIITYLSFFGIFADLGLTLVTTQMVSVPGVNKEKIIGNLLSLRALSAFIFLGIAPLAVIFFPYENIIKLGIAVGALSFFFTALNQIFIGLFQKEFSMGKASMSEIAGRTFLFLGVLISVQKNYGLIGIMIAMIISSLINFIINYIFSKKFVLVKLSFDKEVWIEILKKSWPLAVTIIFNLVYLKADTLILSLIKTQSEVGIYGAAYKVIDVLVTIPFMFAGLVLPIMTASWMEKRMEDFKSALQKSFDAMAILAVPLFVGALFLSEQVMVIVGGSEFAVSGSVLKILMFAAGIIFMGTVFSHGIVAIDEQRRMIKAYVFTSVTSLLGYIILIPAYSYYGAAWVTVYSETVIAFFSFYFLWKLTKTAPKPLIILKSLLASAVMAGVLYLLSKGDYNVFLLLFLGAATYFVSLYFFKGYDSLLIKGMFKIQNKQALN